MIMKANIIFSNQNEILTSTYRSKEIIRSMSTYLFLKNCMCHFYIFVVTYFVCQLNLKIRPVFYVTPVNEFFKATPVTLQKNIFKFHFFKMLLQLICELPFQTTNVDCATPVFQFFQETLWKC